MSTAVTPHATKIFLWLWIYLIIFEISLLLFIFIIYTCDATDFFLGAFGCGGSVNNGWISLVDDLTEK